MTTQKTKLEIIDETAEFYSKNPRSTSNTGCQYLNKDGNKCAFSRCCTDEGVITLHAGYEGVGVDDDVLPLLKPEYQGHDDKFWNAIQNLHDRSHFWGVDGITDDGAAEVSRLKSLYED